MRYRYNAPCQKEERPVPDVPDRYVLDRPRPRRFRMAPARPPTGTVAGGVDAGRWRPGQARRARAAAAASGAPVEAATYTRVSKDEQRIGGVSLEAQLAECRRYVAGMAGRQGWVLGDDFQDVLQGWRDDRPGYL